MRLQECRSCLEGSVLGELDSQTPGSSHHMWPVTTGTEGGQRGHHRMDAGWLLGNASFLPGFEFAHSHGFLCPVVKSSPHPPFFSTLTGISCVQSLEHMLG